MSYYHILENRDVTYQKKKKKAQTTKNDFIWIRSNMMNIVNKLMIQ